MSGLTAPKWLIFKENNYKLLKIQSIGYDDFSRRMKGDFLTMNVWHALYYVRSGSGTLTIGGITYPLKKGDFYFVTPNVPIRYTFREEDPVRYFWFGLYPEFGQEIAEILGVDEVPVKAARTEQRVERILERLLESLQETQAASTEIYFTALSSLMQILSTEFSMNNTGKTSVHREALVDNVKRLIELNFTNPQFQIEAAAQMLYVSHAHMSRVFREATGMTPVAYLVELRLKYAIELISAREAEQQTVKQLSEAAGFGDEWHFMKSFKKRYGMTVGEYREQNRMNQE